MRISSGSHPCEMGSKDHSKPGTQESKCPMPSMEEGFRVPLKPVVSCLNRLGEDFEQLATAITKHN